MYPRTTFILLTGLLVTAGCGAPATPPSIATQPQAEATIPPSSTLSLAATDTPVPLPMWTPTPTPRPEGWVTMETADYPSPRNGHAMTMLPNGRVVLFGGIDESGNALGDTWILDPSAGAQSSARGRHGLLSIIPRPLMADWTPITSPDSPAARAGASFVTLPFDIFGFPAGTVLIFGGSDTQGAWFNDMHAFAAEQWSPITPANDPPSARAYHNAWVRNDRMYVQGGLGDEGLVEDLWRYDLLSNNWEQLPNPPDISLYAYPMVITDTVHLVDVHRLSYTGGTLYYYDMLKEQWGQHKLPGDWPPGDRSGYMMVQVDEKAYMLGGGIWNPDTQTLNPTAEAWVLDLITLTWTRLEDMPYPIYHGGKAVYDPLQDRIIVWGGEQSKGVLVPGNQTLIYYPKR